MHTKIINATNRGGMRGFTAAYESNRSDFTTAAVVGAAIGVGLTAMNDRSNLGTIALSTIAGIAYASSIANNPELGMFDSDTQNCAIVAGFGFATTGLVGAVANTLFGTADNGITEL